MQGLKEAAEAYARLGWAVVPLRAGGKTPAVRGGSRAASADAARCRAWWAQRPDDNVGVACGAASGGLFVLDVDVDEGTGEDGAATLRAWELEHGELPETACALTGRGGVHLYFRAPAGREVRNSANAALGVDVRGEGGFVVAPPSLHPNGRRYEWELPPEEAGVAEADGNTMAFLAYVQAGRGGAGSGAGGGRFELPAAIGAGARNDTLFRYAASLQARGYDDDYIAMAAAAANRERCEPPLPAGDVEALVASATGRYEKGAPAAAGGLARLAGAWTGGDGGAARGGEARPRFRKAGRDGRPTGAVMHNLVARELIEAHRACIIDGAPAVWDGERYAVGWAAVNRDIIGLLDDCKMADQREIRNYILHMAPQREASPPSLIAFRNGVLELDGRGLVPMEPDMYLTNVVPHDYDPDAYDEAADRFLSDVSAGDATVRANLEEVIGLCMYRSSRFGQCPVLVGGGSNGKSTYIKALRNVLGDKNVSSLDISTMGRQFQAGRLLGKLANLGDDISNERLSGDELAVFKKVATGEWIYTDVKNGEGFEFRPFCTLVFSCNEFPSLGDSSEGMMRRLFPIPFDARFERGAPGYDVRISERLARPEAARYLARLGVEGLRRAVAQNGMTPSARSEAIVGEVRSDNDSVLQWAADCDLREADLAGRVIAEAYEEYADWCGDAGLRAFGRAKFTRKANALFGTKSVTERHHYAGGARVVRVFRPADETVSGAGETLSDG